MKVSELIGPMLDLWVAKAEGYEIGKPREPMASGSVLYPFRAPSWKTVGCVMRLADGSWSKNMPRFSTDWSQCGPIIERERICVTGPGPMGGPKPEYYWTAYIDTGSYAGGGHNGHGRSPLIAAMRCFVASKFGEEVDDRQAHIVQG